MQKIEVKKVRVTCECPKQELQAPTLHAPSFEKTLEIVRQATIAVHGIDPLAKSSSFRSEDCDKCNGSGYVVVPNGPDDVEKEPCDNCGGSGRVVTETL